jgi:hypothetical protein
MPLQQRRDIGRRVFADRRCPCQDELKGWGTLVSDCPSIPFDGAHIPEEVEAAFVPMFSANATSSTWTGSRQPSSITAHRAADAVGEALPIAQLLVGRRSPNLTAAPPKEGMARDKPDGGEASGDGWPPGPAPWPIIPWPGGLVYAFRSSGVTLGVGLTMLSISDANASKACNFSRRYWCRS